MATVLSESWLARSARRAVAERAGLSSLQWSQLERLTEAGGAWVPTAATLALGSSVSYEEAMAALLVLGARGLVESDPSPACALTRWRATERGHKLVSSTRT